MTGDHPGQRLPTGVTRFEKDIGRYDGFVHLACAFIALNRLME